MKIPKKVLILLIITGFTGLQFATFLDDPKHLSEPDPDCPLCLAAQNPLYITQDIIITYTPAIILYLLIATPVNPYTNNYISTYCSRAPPLIYSA
jgi:hypothetical protein